MLVSKPCFIMTIYALLRVDIQGIQYNPYRTTTIINNHPLIQPDLV